MKSNKKLLSVLLAVTITSASMVGCGSLDESATIATVGGENIQAGVVNFYTRYQQAFTETYYSMYYGDDMWNMDMGDGLTYEDTSKTSVMEIIQDLYVIRQHAEELEISLSEEEQEAITDVANAMVKANSNDINETISATKENVEEILSLLTLQTKAEKAIKEGVDTEVSNEEANQKKMTVVDFPFSITDEEGNTIEITEEEREENFKTAEALLGEKDLLEKAQEEGYSLQEITFDAESYAVDITIIEAVDGLEQEGEYTEVIETSQGYYIAQLTSLYDEEATEAKKASIITQREEELYTETLDKWIEEANVSVVNSVWKKIKFDKLGVTIYQEPVEEEADIINVEMEGASTDEETGETTEDTLEVEVEVGTQEEQTEE